MNQAASYNGLFRSDRTSVGEKPLESEQSTEENLISRELTESVNEYYVNVAMKLVPDSLELTHELQEVLDVCAQIKRIIHETLGSEKARPKNLQNLKELLSRWKKGTTPESTIGKALKFIQNELKKFLPPAADDTKTKTSLVNPSGAIMETLLLSNQEFALRLRQICQKLREYSYGRFLQADLVRVAGITPNTWAVFYKAGHKKSGMRRFEESRVNGTPNSQEAIVQKLISVFHVRPEFLATGEEPVFSVADPFAEVDPKWSANPAESLSGMEKNFMELFCYLGKLLVGYDVPLFANDFKRITGLDSGSTKEAAHRRKLNGFQEQRLIERGISVKRISTGQGNFLLISEEEFHELYKNKISKKAYGIIDESPVKR